MYPVLLVTIFPVALLSNFWLEVWRGVRSHATDGSGHWGLAQVYNRDIFPDTFGWAGAYFAGMPFPNFYPPLFHWLVGLLQATRMFSFETAFKLILVAPVLFTPAAVWVLAWKLSGESRRVATASACASVLLLVDMRLQTSTCGLDYTSTFVAGFYTQPLGFVLMLAWFVAYLGAHRSRRRASASCVLLALTILANFFNAFTAALLVGSTLAFDVWSLRAAGDEGARSGARRALIFHLLTPFVALSLCLFWLVPMFGTYEYFVTRPLVIPLSNLLSPGLWGWYAVATVGVVLRLREAAAPQVRAYMLALLALVAAVVFASTIAPPWFPLQAFRFLSTLNFMLAVPVGAALGAALDFFQIEIKKPRSAGGVVRHLCVVGLALVAFGVVQATRPTNGLAFYTPRENERLEAVLRFAREHRDGRYLVEVLDVVENPLHADAPALNAYLGAQGNETLSVVYREASPNSIFFNALANSISTGKDSFGISSVLADDLDFDAQPLARQLERARWLGVRYVVVESDVTKERLAREPGIGARRDFDHWSVFEIRGEPARRARVLPYRPALVVSDFSVKGRKRGEYDFVRLAEEQFNDGWFDVLLARAPTKKIDGLDGLEGFGALVLDTYDYADETRAFELLRDYASRHTLVLLASDAPLFRRIQSSLSEFPKAHVVKRPLSEPPGERVESFQPSFHYDQSSVRGVWKEVRALLERDRVAVETSATSVRVEAGANELSVVPDAANTLEDLPVLVADTYSPKWRAREGNRIYAATPFFMLTFTRKPVHLDYARDLFDRTGLWASALTLLALFGYVVTGQRNGARLRHREEETASNAKATLHAGHSSKERRAL
jgi:hypothetical protein